MGSLTIVHGARECLRSFACLKGEGLGLQSVKQSLSDWMMFQGCEGKCRLPVQAMVSWVVKEAKEIGADSYASGPVR